MASEPAPAASAAPADGTAHILCSGKVQGVFYRNNTVKQAQTLGLQGQVRNLEDGRVEIIAAGPKRNVEALVKWCKRGPAKARVEKVEVEWVDGGQGIAVGGDGSSTKDPAGAWKSVNTAGKFLKTGSV